MLVACAPGLPRISVQSLAERLHPAMLVLPFIVMLVGIAGGAVEDVVGAAPVAAVKKRVESKPVSRRFVFGIKFEENVAQPLLADNLIGETSEIPELVQDSTQIHPSPSLNQGHRRRFSE